MNQLHFLTLLIFAATSPSSFATDFLEDVFESSSFTTLDSSPTASSKLSFNSIRVALIKKGKSFTVDAHTTLKQYNPIEGLDGSIYSATRSVKKASWADPFLSAITESEGPQGLTGSAQKLTSDIIVMNSLNLKGKGRGFIFSFGDGRFHMPKKILEPNFGLHVSLNANDAQKVNTHKSQTIA